MSRETGCSPKFLYRVIRSVTGRHMAGGKPGARRLPGAVLVVGVAALSCCVLATWVGGGEARAAAPGERLQEGVFAPGIQETFVPQNQGGARQQQLLAGYVAMGTVGGGEHGLHNAPPPPPPTWSRGGHSWVYDGPQLWKVLIVVIFIGKCTRVVTFENCC